MGRHWYSAAGYTAAIERLTAGRAVFGLGADVMAGFPGETEADHAASVALVRALPFTHLHVFPYSPRPGTAAERVGAPVPPDVARARAAELRAIGAEKAKAYAAGRAGTAADAVVIGAHTAAGSGSPVRKALTEDYLEVRLKGEFPRGSRLHVTLGPDSTATSH
jgi:threonylcarbamoyladenosine tRNA methylthiotransferase MtaB